MNDITLKQPSEKGLEQLIQDLKEIETLACRKGAFDMDEPRVLCNKDDYYGYNSCDVYECNTVHCFAGWIMAHHINKKNSEFKDNFYNYCTGIEIICKMLGYNDFNQLLDWADKNPAIWGNTNGRNMFTTYSAFESYDLDSNMINSGYNFMHIRIKFENVKAKLYN
jgi:hypothetical protein